MTKNATLQLTGVERNVSLAPFTTMKLGGPAECFFRAKTVEDVQHAIRSARAAHLPVTVLGGGSNVIIADAGIRGLVLLVAISGVERHGDRLHVGAGENLQRLVSWTARQGFAGLEFGIGIYGTVGGGVAGNAGAFGSEMATVVRSVQAVDAEGNEKTYTPGECGFSYRRSRFIREGAVVTGVELAIHSGDPKEISALVKEHLSKKQSAQPLGSRSAGCIFRNHHAELRRDAELLTRFSDSVRGSEIPARALIVESGLAGEHLGGIRISDQHANFFVNDGSGTAEQVIILVSRVQQRVRDAFGVELVPEVRFVGFA